MDYSVSVLDAAALMQVLNQIILSEMICETEINLSRNKRPCHVKW